MNSFLFKIIDILLHFLPMNNNLVFFSSFEDQYSDHPKAISEKVHELYPDVLIVWPFSDRAKLDRVPEYVIKVKINSVRHAILK